MSLYLTFTSTGEDQFWGYSGKCPFCQFAIHPILAHARNVASYAELFLICPRPICGKGHVAGFEKIKDKRVYLFKEICKGRPEQISFSEIIKNTSEQFITIYSEAHHAEEEGLLNICGVGYRKAFEFLIKDYLIKKHPDQSDTIKEKFLGACIQNYIEHPKIKAVAKRTAWLGNDETHYTRKWVDKDLQDLKKLIDLTKSWIEVEVHTDELEREMPE